MTFLNRSLSKFVYRLFCVNVCAGMETPTKSRKRHADNVLSPQVVRTLRRRKIELGGLDEDLATQRVAILQSYQIKNLSDKVEFLELERVIQNL